MIIIVGTFGQALSGQAHAVNIIAVLIVWRVIVSILNSFIALPLDILNEIIKLDGNRHWW